MKINVTYSAQLRQAAGLSGEEISLAGPCSVAAFVVEQIAPRHEKLSELILDSAGKLRPHLFICVDDEQVFDLQKQILKDGDRLLLMTPISGG